MNEMKVEKKIKVKWKLREPVTSLKRSNNTWKNYGKEVRASEIEKIKKANLNH